MTERDTAALVETVRKALDALEFDFADDSDDPMALEPRAWPTERMTEQAIAGLDALAQRLADADDRISTLESVVLLKASERDAAEARATRAEEALLAAIRFISHLREVNLGAVVDARVLDDLRAYQRAIARAALTPTEEPEPGSPEYEAQTDAFLHAIGVEEPEQWAR